MISWRDLAESRLMRGGVLLVASVCWWFGAPYVLTWMLGPYVAILILIFARAPAAVLGLVGLVMVLGEWFGRER